ncbi:ankyrin repeat domain-containing protein [Candidatus Dependentiae bacterium]
MKKCRFYCFPILLWCFLRLFCINNHTYKDDFAKLKNDSFSLFDAIVMGDLEKAKPLIEKFGPEITFDCRHGNRYKELFGEFRSFVDSTPLHVASFMGHLKIVKYLVEKKQVNINAKDNFSYCSLYYACQEGYIDVAKYLVKKEAKVNRRNKYFYPFFVACEKGHLEIVKFLVKNGVIINHKDEKGYTALYYAAKNGKFEVFRYLIELGAKTDTIIDGERDLKKKLLDTATKRGKLHIVSYSMNNRNKEKIKKLVRSLYFSIRGKDAKSKKTCDYFAAVEDFDNAKNKPKFLWRKILNKKKLTDVKSLIFMALRRTLHRSSGKDYCKLCIGLWKKMSTCKKLKNIVSNAFNIDEKNSVKHYYNYVIKEMQACNFTSKKSGEIEKDLIASKHKESFKRNLYNSGQNYSDILIKFNEI